MKELSNKLLPIQIEGELNKEWDFLSEEYIGLLARTGRGMKYSLSFPVESHVSVTSPRTGIVWNIMIMLEDPKVIHYAFYTFYTNEYGERGIYLIDEYRCSRVTPHYMKRLNSRYLKPKGIRYNDEHDGIFQKRQIDESDDVMFVIIPDTFWLQIPSCVGIAIQNTWHTTKD